MANIKDYIIDLDQVNETVVGDTAKKPVVKPSVVYEVVLENDMDFILNRKSSRMDKDLVFLVSQDLFYIKDNKTDTVTKLDRDNFKKQVGMFTKDMTSHSIFTKIRWGKSCFTDDLYSVFYDDSKKKFIRAGMYELESWEMSRYGDYLDKNKKLFKYVLDKFGRRTSSSMLSAVFYLHDKFSYNNAVFLIDKLVEMDSPMIKDSSYLKESLTLLTTSDCKFDTNTFISYIVNELYTQGIDKISYDAYHNYRDYLAMCAELHDGKVKVKYPKHLKTDHDKLVMKYNLWKRYKDDLAILKLTDEYKKLAFTGKDCSIILPKNSADIVDEGVQMSNCVGTYVKRIAEGDTFVCFMRKNEDLDHSYVTIEVNNGKVCQVKGFANRVTTKEEDDFVKKWAKEKDLKVTYKQL